MYLPLAAVVTAVVVVGFLAGQWLVRRRFVSPLAAQLVGGALLMFAALALAAGTFDRNWDYRSRVTIWEATVARVPGNERAQNALGAALVSCGQLDEATIHFQKALAIRPDDEMPHNNLGVILARRGQMDEAIAHFRQALTIKPDCKEARQNLAAALARKRPAD